MIAELKPLWVPGDSSFRIVTPITFLTVQARYFSINTFKYHRKIADIQTDNAIYSPKIIRHITIL